MGESIERLILRAVAKGVCSLRYIGQGTLIIGKSKYIVDTIDGVPVDTSGLRAALDKAISEAK